MKRYFIVGQWIVLVRIVLENGENCSGLSLCRIEQILAHLSPCSMGTRVFGTADDAISIDSLQCRSHC